MNAKERAVFRRKIEASSVPGTEQVVYIGDEFCERRLPAPEALVEALDACAAAGRRLCLATPCLTDAGLARLSPLLEILRGARNPCDIVINDWGALRLLGNGGPGPDVWLGRLITTRHCQVPPPGYQVSSSGIARFVATLRASGITGVEMNSIRALAAHLPAFRESGLKTAIHTPFLFLTMTRCCPCVGAGQWYYRDSLLSCGRECDRYTGVLEATLKGSELHIAGNALFMRRDLEPLMPDLSADRLIDNRRLIP